MKFCRGILILVVGGVMLGRPPAAPEAAEVILRAGFEDRELEGFQSDFGGTLEVTDEDFSVGRFALKASIEAGVKDVERYVKYTDRDTKIGFHYKACGMRIIRVLAQSVEDRENLYFNLKDVPQNRWEWARVRVAELRNVVPRHGGPECPFGDRTGEGKTFRNLVFHLTGIPKDVEAPCVYLDNIVIYSGKDETPPVVRGMPEIRVDAQGRFLSWADAQDDVGVAFYRVLRADHKEAPLEVWVVAGETVIPEYALPQGGGWYRVVAVDYDGNTSVPSPAAEVPPVEVQNR